MKLTRYIYQGPRSSAPLRVEGKVIDVPLIPGQPCELPADHDYTKTLIAMKYLTPAPSRKAADEAVQDGGKA